MQAAAVRDFLQREGIVIDRAYASPLSRAVDTARIVTGGSCPLFLEERLTEMDYGPWEGASLVSPPEEIRRFFSSFSEEEAPAGMEPLGDVVKRLGSFLMETAALAERENILLSTHAVALKGALEFLTPDAGGAFWGRYIGNGALFACACRDGIYSLPGELFTPPRAEKEKDDGKKAPGGAFTERSNQ